MTPWLARVRLDATLSVLALTASLGVVVSCVSVTASAAAPGGGAGAVEASLAVALSPTIRPTAPVAAPSQTTPVATPSPTASAVFAASASPTPPASSEAIQARAAASSAGPAPFTGPGGSATDPRGERQARRARPATLDDATRRKLQSILRKTVSRKGVAGLQAAVRLPDGETWLGSAGHAEFLPDRPVGEDTVFSIASVTKTFVAALILQLAEEGKLDLDEPFGRFVPDAPRKDSVTIRQLLSHTSGIYNYFEHPRYFKISGAWLRPTSGPGLLSREHRWTYPEIMSLVKTGYCKPGECYHYSNTNYVILGRVAEAAGGAPIGQQIRQRFLEPLGLEDTVYQPDELPPDDKAHGHWDTGTGYSDHTRDAQVLPFMAAVSVADAAGAIASTARDLSVWADALYGGHVLEPESLAQMTDFQAPGSYGLGTDVATFAGHRGRGHRGGLRGFEASMWYFPREGVSVVLLSNQGNWLTDVPMGKLVKAVLGKG